MSTDRPTRDTLVFHCETCSETLEFGPMTPDELGEDGRVDFPMAWDTAQVEGWVAFRTGDPAQEWGHMCPSCAEK